MKLSQSIQAFIPAAFLAALVLFVFSTLQNYGPESAVRRFHEGILRMDRAEIDEVTVAAHSEAEAEEKAHVEGLIYDILNENRNVRLRDLQRSPKQVDVTVLYFSGNGTALGNAPYVTVKEVTGWKVDVHKTLVLWNKMFRPSVQPGNG